MKTLLIASALLLTHAGIVIAQESQSNDSQMKQHHHMPGMDMSAPTGSQAAMDHSKINDDHDMSSMDGVYGTYPMTRDASGTSWQPDSSPHDGIHGTLGDWSTMV